jgi:hypothetical protein
MFVVNLPDEVVRGFDSPSHDLQSKPERQRNSCRTVPV